MTKTAVVALGGNALTLPGQAGRCEEMLANAAEMAAAISEIMDAGWRVVVVHGNGPQVGSLALQQESATLVPAQPLPGSSRGGPGRRGDLRGHSVEVEFVALDVLHHDARLVVVIGRQKSHAYRAERDQSCAFGLERGQALFTDEPGADPDVKMHPVLDDLAFGDALEVQSRAHT